MPTTSALSVTNRGDGVPNFSSALGSGAEIRPVRSAISRRAPKVPDRKRWSPMKDLPARDRSALQKSIGRGFAPPPVASQSFKLVSDHRPEPSRLPKVAIFLPTMVRCVLSGDIGDYLTGLAAQIVTAAQERAVELHLIVAMQFGGDGAAAGERALETVLGTLEARLAGAGGKVGLAAIALEGPGKVVSINAMTELALARGIEAVLLIDDDVGFNDGCFSRMLGAYLAAPRPIAIGARKIGRPFETRASAVLHTLKGFTQPAENYPHACCMIVSIEVISPEIPPIYSSDDGYICFRLLAPAEADPLRRLVMVDGAYCHHWVGGRDAGEISSRIRRMLLHHHLFLSHSEPAQARYYLRSMLFFGLWPWVAFDTSKGLGHGTIKCLLKHVYAIWFAKIGFELIVRGIVGRPLREISWGSVGRGAGAETAE